ncbi:MAG: hypothetical protein NVSMB64_25510 [Candidatus Velthaea sp.]
MFAQPYSATINAPTLPPLLALIEGLFCIGDAAAILEFGKERALSALRHWSASALIVVEDDSGNTRYRIAEAARAAALGQLTAAQERRLHGRIARRLQSHCGSSPLLLARHLRHSGDLARSVSTYMHVAHTLSSEGRVRAAYGVLLEAAGHNSMQHYTVVLYEDCAALALQCGEVVEAERLLLRLRDYHRRLGDVSSDALVCVRLSELALLARNHDAARAYVEHACKCLGSGELVELNARARLARVRVAIRDGDVEPALADLRALETADCAQVPAIRSLVVECVALVDLMRASEPAPTRVTGALSQRLIAGDGSGVLRLLGIEAESKRASGDINAAIALLAPVVDRSQACELTLDDALLMCLAMRFLHEADRHSEALVLSAAVRPLCAGAVPLDWAAASLAIAVQARDEDLIRACKPETLAGAVLLPGNTDLLARAAPALHSALRARDQRGADALLVRAAQCIARTPFCEFTFWLEALAIGAPGITEAAREALPRLFERRAPLDETGARLVASVLALDSSSNKRADFEANLLDLRRLGMNRSVRIARRIAER